MGKKKEDMDDEMYVTLSLDDGDVECVVITIFTAGDRDYIALLPTEEAMQYNLCRSEGKTGKFISTDMRKMHREIQVLPILNQMKNLRLYPIALMSGWMNRNMQKCQNK